MRYFYITIIDTSQTPPVGRVVVTPHEEDISATESLLEEHERMFVNDL